MKATRKFKFTRASTVNPIYRVTRLEDSLVIGSVWRERLGWTSSIAWKRRNGEATHHPSREAAARDLSFELPPIKKSRVWVSLVHEGRSISFITEVDDSDVEALHPETFSHASCAITFEGRGIVAGHLWKVEEGS